MPYGRRRFLSSGNAIVALLWLILVALSLPTLALAQFKMPDQKSARVRSYGPVTSGAAILKGNGAGGVTNAISGTDYAPPTSGNGLLKGNGAGGFSAALSGSDYVPPVDVNNHTTVAAHDAGNDGKNINEIGTDAANVVHIGGGAASAISLDNSTSLNQGQFSSAAYLDFPVNNTNWSGGTENCAQKWHVFTIAANATLTLSCTGTSNQTLDYLIYQPNTGSTFTYTFAPGNGAALYGAAPVPCTANGCVDHIEVTWVPSRNNYIIAEVQSNATQTSACPAGQTCYYFSASSGNDATGAGTVASPWQSLSKAMSVLSTLKPGDRELFKGGDVWTASSSNPAFTFGDVAAHAVSGSAAKPIVISSYGSGRAIIDAANTNAYCFAAIDPTTNWPPANTVQYLALSNFECEHAQAQGVTFNGTGQVGITVTNMYIHNTGHGCATTANGACKPTEEDPLDWQSGHAYVANDATHDATIEPRTGNSGGWWFKQTAANCTSGASNPSWSTAQSFGQSVTEGSPACTWVNIGVSGVYKNQLQAFNSNAGGYANGIHFVNNVVKWCGGHNCLQVHHDTGAVVVQGNTLGPGGVHGILDVKSVGSPTTPAQIIGNTATCGYSLGLCGCQNSGSVGHSNCASNMTPAVFTLNETTGVNETVLYQLNTVYDSGIGFQVCPNSTATGCGSSTSCPIFAKYYNNTVYLPTGLSDSYAIYGSCGLNASNSTIDMRNNIFDGAGTATVSVSSGWQSSGTLEDYNDIGGVQGNAGFSFNGSSVQATHDFNNVNPMYVNAGSIPPNLGLLSGSPCLNAGLTGLTSGNSNMGAY